MIALAAFLVHLPSNPPDAFYQSLLVSYRTAITQSDWRTCEEARRAIFAYIETWYN